jgi:uncharacterized protein YprB with RNaseH-like and TPR domain
MPLFRKRTSEEPIKWTEEEDALLIKLRNRNVPYSDLLAVFPGRTQDGIRSRNFRVRKVKNNEWTVQETLAVIDIETSDLSANNGMMLSWSVRYLDGKEKHDCITKKEIFEGTFDKRIVNSLVEELKKVDVVIGYYSSGFDIPFIRTRAMYWNIEFFSPKALKSIDLYFCVKFKMKLTRNSLDAATHFLGIEGKTHLDIRVWGEARYGNVQALKEVLAHNIADTEITLSLYNKLKDLVNFTKKSI